MKQKIIAMIPARMGSSRYPGKPIVDICGKSMIEHVWQRVRLNPKVDEIYIATCDEEIKAVAESFGAKVIMTSADHERCTDRVAEACRKLVDQGDNFDIILNIQGDEPLLHPKTLDILIEPFLQGKNIVAVNLIELLETDEEINSYNNVKAIFDQNGFAMYFSRLPIPYGAKNQHYKQLGVYGLTKDTIYKYAEMEETPLEIAESDDMLRFIENGIPVKVVLSHYKTKGVDVPEDRDQVIEQLKTDEVFQMYKDQ